MNDKEKNVRVAWISGGYHRGRTLFKKIKEKFAHLDCFECTEETSFEYLMMQLQSDSCFDEGKLVTVFGLPKMTDSQKKKFRAVIEKLGNSLYVVFFNLDPAKEKALLTLVQNVGKVYEFEETMDQKSAVAWVQNRCSELKAGIDERTANALVQACGYDPALNAIGVDMLEMAVRRLKLYDPSKKEFDLADVTATTVFLENFVIWDLLGACDSKDYDRCQMLLSKMSAGDEDPRGSVHHLLSTLAWKYRLLLFLKDRFATFKGDNAKHQIMQEAGALRKFSSDGQGFAAVLKCEPVASGPNAGKPSAQWSSGVITTALDGFYGRPASLGLYSRVELYVINQSIYEAMISLRQATSESAAIMIADTVLMSICSKLNHRQSKQLLKSFQNEFAEVQE
jgi:DNA polymerase III delta subunit